jgi:hypothetical protein
MEGFDAMNDAPEKIWAWDFTASKQNEVMTGGWHYEAEVIDSDKETEYTRSDITQARLDKLEAALKDCEEEIDQYVRQEYPHDHPVQERYRQRGFASNPARIALAALEEGEYE